MIQLKDDKTFIIPKGTRREELIEKMKEEGIKIKCISVSSILKRGGEVGPGLDIKFVTTESKKSSCIRAKSKEIATELLELRNKEDCERINRELET